MNNEPSIAAAASAFRVSPISRSVVAVANANANRSSSVCTFLFASGYTFVLSVEIISCPSGDRVLCYTRADICSSFRDYILPYICSHPLWVGVAVVLFFVYVSGSVFCLMICVAPPRVCDVLRVEALNSFHRCEAQMTSCRQHSKN